MNLTTLTRVKRRLSESGTTDDVMIGEIIAGTSRAAELYCAREFRFAAYIEMFDVAPRQVVFPLQAPGPNLRISNVWNDVLSTFAASQLVSTADYVVDETTGLLSFKRWLSTGFRALKVSYQGGVAGDADGLVALGFDDIVEALTAQCVHEYQRRANNGLTGYTLPGTSVQIPDRQTWLPQVKSVLDCRRRMVYV